MREPSYILLTGVPRSGSTLVCQLLSESPDVVVLDEPLEENYGLYKVPESDFLGVIDKKFAEWRRMIQHEGVAVTVHRADHLTQHYGDELNSRGLRERVVACGQARVKKELSDDFTIVVKQLLAFSMHIESLSREYPVFGIVRNPLAVLASLNTLSSWESGYFHHYRTFAPDWVEKWEAIDDKIDRLIAVMSIYYEKCYPLLQDGRVLFYEELVATQGHLLASVVPLPERRNWSLVNKNGNRLYDPSNMIRMGEKLLRSDGPFWDFYTREAVVELMEQVQEHDVDSEPSGPQSLSATSRSS